MRTVFILFAIIAGSLISTPASCQEESAAPANTEITDAPAKSQSADTPIKFTPDYQNNLTLFYFLIGGIVVLIIVIIGLSSSIRTLVRSDYFKNKMSDKGANGTIHTILVLFALTAFSNSANALTFNGPGEAADKMPWLLVENTDLYYLVAINLTLLGVVMYMRKMFNDFIRLIADEKVEPEVPVPAMIRKVNSVLTDAVPIDEEASILLNHEYDGIRELDNNLPPWWVWGFYATIIFAVIYIFNYHLLGVSDLQIEEYQKEMKQAEIDIAIYRKKMAMNVDENNVTLMIDDQNLGTGKSIFTKNCASCHEANGSGNNGPNLTDNYWIYGFDIKQVFTTVKLGRPNGMPEHNSKLNPIEIQQVASFVLSLPKVDGKESQGEIIEE